MTQRKRETNSCFKPVYQSPERRRTYYSLTAGSDDGGDWRM